MAGLIPLLNSQAPEEAVIIPLWLRDTYARITPTPIYDLAGFVTEDIQSSVAARDALQQEVAGTSSDLFRSGADIFSYLSEHLDLCGQTITFVIIGLRDLYWTNRDNLSREEIDKLHVALRYPLPNFKNIFEYKNLDSQRGVIPVPLYQLFGTITAFSVIHVPVKYFIAALNAQQPLRVALSGTNIVIELQYRPYDFWDPGSESLINHIELSRC
jgi:hypothetical protein